MIKIFLVEDEFVVREGIKKNVDWAGHGYDFIGEAGDGELALPLIRAGKPDIVITDIRMPFMDGLELSRRIKAEFPETEIIILSGYAEFEYAKEGLKIGVSEYLTKPINSEDLLHAVDVIAAQIVEKKKNRGVNEKLAEVQNDLVGRIKEMYSDIGLKSDDFDAAAIDPKSVNMAGVEAFLKTGKLADADSFVEKYLNDLNGSEDSFIFRQYISLGLYFAASSFVEDLGLNKNEIPALDLKSGVLNSTESTKEYLSSVFKSAISGRDRVARGRYGSLLDDAVSYISEHYGDSSLSLNTVADAVNVTPNYLSNLFSQQSGKNFVKYITDLRIEKAKELLLCTSKKSSEICEEVGYDDPHYFSSIFKKTTGMTPTQFREGGQ